MEELADRSLELAVWDHDRMGHQDFLGGVRLNLGTGTDHITTIKSHQMLNYSEKQKITTHTHCTT